MDGTEADWCHDAERSTAQTATVSLKNRRIIRPNVRLSKLPAATGFLWLSHVMVATGIALLTNNTFLYLPNQQFDWNNFDSSGKATEASRVIVRDGHANRHLFKWNCYRKLFELSWRILMSCPSTMPLFCLNPREHCRVAPQSYDNSKAEQLPMLSSEMIKTSGVDRRFMAPPNSNICFPVGFNRPK